MRTACLAIAGFAALAAALAACSKDAEATGTAPDFTLEEIEGGQVSLSDYRGRAVLLVFWAVGCPPCRREVPALIEVSDRYRAEGLTVLAVNAWNEPPEAVRQFAGQQGIRYPVLLRGRSAALQYSIRAIPAVFYIDPQGRLAGNHVGLLSLDELEAGVKKILPR
jgi:thiol-disulfide isomerase/thioredoxin